MGLSTMLRMRYEDGQRVESVFMCDAWSPSRSALHAGANRRPSWKIWHWIWRWVIPQWDVGQ